MPAERSRRTSSQPYHLDPRPALDPPRPLHPRAEEADLVVESESASSLSQQRGGEGGRQHEHAPYTRHLTPAERTMAAFLREEFAFVGARAFVAQFGVPAIKEAIADLDAGDPRSIRNPAGFLRWLVAQQERR